MTNVFLYRENILYVLRLLAASADEQLEILAGMCVADELALETNRVFMVAKETLERGLITYNQFEGLKELDDFFTRMSDGQHQDFWTDEALVRRPEWEQVRRTAQRLLAGSAGTVGG